MKTNYTTKYLVLEHEITETADLYDFPIITMFADRENLGNLIEVTFEEWNGFEYVVTGTNVKTVEDANEFYTKYIKDYNYKVVREEVC